MLPADRAVVLQVATLEVSGWDPQPVMPPPEKATVPVGLEPPVTVAVKVTLEPTAREAAEAVNAVVVEPSVTVSVMVLEVDAMFLASPP